MLAHRSAQPTRLRTGGGGGLCYRGIHVPLTSSVLVGRADWALLAPPHSPHRPQSSGPTLHPRERNAWRGIAATLQCPTPHPHHSALDRDISIPSAAGRRHRVERRHGVFRVRLGRGQARIRPGDVQGQCCQTSGTRPCPCLRLERVPPKGCPFGNVFFYFPLRRA